jgi:hypothetical protein
MKSRQIKRLREMEKQPFHMDSHMTSLKGIIALTKKKTTSTHTLSCGIVIGMLFLLKDAVDDH